MISLLANSCLLLNKPRSSLELLYNVRVVRHHVLQQWRGIRMEVSSCSLGELYQFITKQQWAEGVSVWQLPHKFIFMKCSCCVFLSWYPSELQSMISEKKLLCSKWKIKVTGQLRYTLSRVEMWQDLTLNRLSNLLVLSYERWTGGQGLSMGRGCSSTNNQISLQLLIRTTSNTANDKKCK